MRLIVLLLVLIISVSEAYSQHAAFNDALKCDKCLATPSVIANMGFAQSASDMQALSMNRFGNRFEPSFNPMPFTSAMRLRMDRNNMSLTESGAVSESVLRGHIAALLAGNRFYGFAMNIERANQHLSIWHRSLRFGFYSNPIGGGVGPRIDFALSHNSRLMFAGASSGDGNHVFFGSFWWRPNMQDMEALHLRYFFK